jgi:hypothetical protein
MIMAALAALTMLTSACANRSTGSAAATRGPTGPTGDVTEPIELDFQAPLGPLGRPVTALNTAGLPFVPMAPAIGTGHTSFVYTPADPVSAEVGLVYDDPSWDHVIVREHIDTMSQDDLIKFDESLVNQGCVSVPEEGPDAVSCDYDPFTQIDIGGGIIALLGSTPEGTGTGLTSLEWVEPLNPTGIGGIPAGNNMVIEVLGYATTFSPDEATQFAKSFTASMAKGS